MTAQDVEITYDRFGGQFRTEINLGPWFAGPYSAAFSRAELLRKGTVELIEAGTITGADVAAVSTELAKLWTWSEADGPMTTTTNKYADGDPRNPRRYRNLVRIPEARRWLFERLELLTYAAEHASTATKRALATAELKVLRFHMLVVGLLGSGGKRRVSSKDRYRTGEYR